MESGELLERVEYHKNILEKVFTEEKELCKQIQILQQKDLKQMTSEKSTEIPALRAKEG